MLLSDIDYSNQLSKVQCFSVKKKIFQLVKVFIVDRDRDCMVVGFTTTWAIGAYCH